jgi:hypothetical protein
VNVPRGTPHVHHVSTADGTVLLDADGGRLYGLNPTASMIWQALSAGRSVEQIICDVTVRFDAPPDRVRADVSTLVAQLQDRGLVAATTG